MLSEDDNGKNSAELDTLFSVPPKILTVPASAVGQVSADIELVCSVHGVPKPSVHWLKNGDSVIPSDYFQLVDGYNLRILGLVLSDAGMYQCVASNAVGSAQTTAQLVVKEIGECEYHIYKFNREPFACNVFRILLGRSV